MSGPVDAIGPRRSDSQPKNGDRASNNLSAWGESTAGKPWFAIMLNIAMYGILIVAGFGVYTSFSLDPVVLATLIGATAGVAVPYHIRMAINITRGSNDA